MGDIVGLHGCPIPLENDELCEDLARFSDGTLSESQVKARHHLSNDVWAKLAEDDALVERIEARKLQRIRSGQTKRERAQLEIVDAPPILGKLMRSADTNPRHVIDAAKTLDGLATGGGEAAGAGTTFTITINLGADGSDHIEHYSKSVAIDPNPNDTDVEPQDVIAAITMKKDDDGGQGYL